MIDYDAGVQADGDGAMQGVMIVAAVLASQADGGSTPLDARPTGMAAKLLAKAAKQSAESQGEQKGERVVSGDALVPVVVDGRTLHLRIEPGVPGMVLVAPTLKEQLGFRKGGFFGIDVCYRFGHEHTCGHTHVVHFAWEGEKAGKRRIGSMSRAYQPPADGTVGPAGLPQQVIRFVLHPARAGERTVALPMNGGSGLFGSWFTIDGLATIAGVPMHLRFDPHHPRSLANASAAVALAASNAGVMTAETGRQEIAFGIERPYRMMKLARPLTIGGLSLAGIGVRVTDGNIAGRIAEEGAAAEAADPDEVVVTAKKGKPPVHQLILGADALAGCSSIVFDKPAREVRLTCGG